MAKLTEAQWREWVTKNVPDTSVNGYAWVFSEVSTDDGKITLGYIPLVHITDLPKFTAFMGGDANVLAMLNGSSSPRVKAQGAGRRTLLKNSTVSAEDLFDACESAAFSRSTRRTVTVTVEKRIWLADDGSEFGTKEEALEYNKVLRADQEVQQ